MDNFYINIVGQGGDLLRKAVEIAFSHAPGRKATAYVLRNNTMIFLWGDFEKIPDRVALPFEMTAEFSADLAERWLAVTEYGDEPDHDGDNRKGWRVFNEDWGHVCGLHAAICGIRPEWAMYGK